MKTKYKYIYFIEMSLDMSDNKTIRAYECRNNKSNDILGYIYWYPNWRDFVFTQADSRVIFNSSCLLDIVDFIKQIKKEQKGGGK